jgi:hypothetical protein
VVSGRFRLPRDKQGNYTTSNDGFFTLPPEVAANLELFKEHAESTRQREELSRWITDVRPTPVTITRPDEIILTAPQFDTLIEAVLAAFDAGAVSDDLSERLDRVATEIRERWDRSCLVYPLPSEPGAIDDQGSNSRSPCARTDGASNG